MPAITIVMTEENLEAPCANMDILLAGLDICHKLTDNLV